MITNPQLFIIGAGASVSYGLPSGPKLVQDILKRIEEIISISNEVPNMKKHWVDDLGFDLAELGELKQGLKWASTPSIDRFLERRPEYIDIGKRMIALVLLEEEGRVDYSTSSDHWLQYLWNSMITEPRHFAKNKVTFISFNYDRLIERFFYNAFVGMFGMDPLDAIEQVEKMEIIHVHGTLGSLNSSADNYVPFGNVERSSLDRATSSIVIVHEAIGLDTFLDAKVLLGRQAATHIIGLGLDKTNFNRLDLQKVSPQNSIGSVNGTFFGLTEHEVMQFQSKFQRIRLCKNSKHYDVAKNHRCLDYLRNNVLLN